MLVKCVSLEARPQAAFQPHFLRADAGGALLPQRGAQPPPGPHNFPRVPLSRLALPPLSAAALGRRRRRRGRAGGGRSVHPPAAVDEPICGRSPALPPPSRIPPQLSPPGHRYPERCSPPGSSLSSNPEAPDAPPADLLRLLPVRLLPAPPPRPPPRCQPPASALPQAFPTFPAGSRGLCRRPLACPARPAGARGAAACGGQGSLAGQRLGAATAPRALRRVCPSPFPPRQGNAEGARPGELPPAPLGQPDRRRRRLPRGRGEPLAGKGDPVGAGGARSGGAPGSGAGSGSGAAPGGAGPAPPAPPGPPGALRHRAAHKAGLAAPPPGRRGKRRRPAPPPAALTDRLTRAEGRPLPL
ncbi:basic proline-rich protein-like [Prinia subflava]|uniref:basic proline-rich protein-like n=1 Tax=Prinia subflava TaxID=208062 RepID=UPI002FE001C3